MAKASGKLLHAHRLWGGDWVSDDLKQLLDGLGFVVDSDDAELLAKAAQAAGVLARFIDPYDPVASDSLASWLKARIARAAGNLAGLVHPKPIALPEAHSFRTWLEEQKGRKGAIEWHLTGTTSRLSASELAKLWDNVGGPYYRFAVPLEMAVKSATPVTIAFESQRARPRALSMLEGRDWSGKWHWPLRIAVLPNAPGIALANELERIPMVGRGLATVRVLDDVTDTCDLLLVPEGFDSDFKAYLEPLASGTIGSIAVLVGAPDPLTDKLRELSSIRTLHGAGAGILVDLPDKAAMANWANSVAFNLSHNHTIDEAVWRVRDARDVSRVVATATEMPLVVSTFPAVKEAPLTQAIRGMADQARAAPAGGRIIVPYAMKRTLGHGLATSSNGAAIASSLEASVDKQDQFLREGDGATGAAAQGWAIDDSASGGKERFPDVMLYRYDAGAVGTKLAENEKLTVDRSYVLEFALRSQRVGIGFDADPEPLKGVPDGDCDLLVSVSVRHEDDANVPEPTQHLRLPKEGDSKPVRFVFTPKRIPDGGFLNVEIRVYYRFNLIDYLVLRSMVAAEEGQHDSPAHAVRQQEAAGRYAEANLELQAPRLMNIHVTQEGDGYWLRFEIAKVPGDGNTVEMGAYAPITSVDLGNELERIRDLLITLALDRYGKALRAESEVESQSWNELADAGRDLWGLLFRGAQGGALDAVRKFLEANPLPAGSAVQIVLAETARSFVFPWALLHDGAGNAVWGLRYVIEQKVETRSIRDSLAPLASPPAASVMLYKRLTQAVSQLHLLKEIYDRSGRRVLGDAPVESRKELQKLLGDCDAQLLYFFCHGYTPFPIDGWMNPFLHALAERPGSDELAQKLQEIMKAAGFDKRDASIELTKSLIRLRELEREPVDLRGQPIVFLNMCQSAQVLPRLTGSFVDFFLRKRARSVLGTECPVPPAFADAFAHQIIPQLVSGTAIGQALLDARRALAKDCGNPLGLAYTLWGAADTRYTPAAIDAAAATQLLAEWRKEIAREHRA